MEVCDNADSDNRAAATNSVFEELHFHRTQAKLDAYEEDFW
jgi:hypothetical protein